ncbi:MAG: zinc ribbon domain-containing protein, partial [Ruminiclostridium sp.]|nr:zinc ribbon domain-containing protein [Ruminiclostridium sp.]
MICSKCGKEIEQGAVFCPFCGSRTGEPVPEAFLKEVRKEEQAPGLSAATPSDTGSPVVGSVP